VSRDEDHGLGERPLLGGAEALCNGEAVVGTEVDVDQREVRSQLTGESHGVLAAGGDGQDVYPLLLEDLLGGLRESQVVVDYEAPYRHALER
jgi:hypothetical protein